MNKLVNFLKAEVKSSVESLVQGLVAKIKRATTTDTILTFMVTAAITVLRGMNMAEEIRLLNLLIVCHFGGKGLEVPESIAKLFSGAVPAPTVSKLVAVPPAPAKQVAAATMAATMPVNAPIPATVPERTLLRSEPDGSFKTWVGFLKGVANGKNVPWKTLQTLTAKLFNTGMKLSQDQWELLFSAMKKADERGNYIVNSAAKPATVFTAAPLELVDDYLFGQDGAVPALTGEFADIDGAVPEWLWSKASVVLDSILALDEIKDIGEQEWGLVDKLLDATGGRENTPNWIEKRRATLLPIKEEETISSPVTEKVGNGGARISGGEAALRAIAAAVEAGKKASAEFVSALQ